MTETFKQTEATKQIEGRVFLMEGKAWLVTEPLKNRYVIDDAEFLDKCSEHIREIQHLTTAALVRRERTTDVVPHVVSGRSVVVMQMTVHGGRE